jgi:cytochrome c5
MKKLMLVLTVGAFLAACGDSTTTKTESTTDTTMSTTTPAMAPAMSDTTNKMMTDSTHSMMSADSTKK